MSYKEKDIMHENGKFWVLKNKEGFHVMVSGGGWRIASVRVLIVS